MVQILAAIKNNTKTMPHISMAYLSDSLCSIGLNSNFKEFRTKEHTKCTKNYIDINFFSWILDAP